MWCAPVLLVLCLFFGASFQCGEMVSVEGYSLIGHAVTSLQVPSLQECMWECSGMEWCKSLTYNYANWSCDLNNVTKELHPGDYVAKEGFVYWGGFHILSSCAEIKDKYPDSKSGDYKIMLGGREVQVFCDMDNHGGGWTLVVTIDKNSKNHWKRQQYCSKPTFCVPFKDLSDNQVLHKFEDEDIHQLANGEGVFRVDLLPGPTVTQFYKIPSGVEKFDSSCYQGRCPRLIVSNKYPYEWKSSPCKGLEVGYQLRRGNHRVFDTWDNSECGFRFKAPGGRILYGYVNPGIHPYRAGLLYVK